MISIPNSEKRETFSCNQIFAAPIGQISFLRHVPFKFIDLSASSLFLKQAQN